MQVLLSGSIIANKREFVTSIQKFADVTIIDDNQRLLGVIDQSHVDILVFEVQNNRQNALDILMKIKQRYPDTKIILISNDRAFTALAFNLGVKDVYKSPVNFGLLNEIPNAAHLLQPKFGPNESELYAICAFYLSP